MIDPGWVLNPSTWLLVGAVCLLLEIFARGLFFMGLGISGAVIAALVCRFADCFVSAGDPFLTTSLAFLVVGLVVWAILWLIFRRRRSQARLRG